MWYNKQSFHRCIRQNGKWGSETDEQVGRKAAGLDHAARAVAGMSGGAGAGNVSALVLSAQSDGGSGIFEFRVVRRHPGGRYEGRADSGASV